MKTAGIYFSRKDLETEEKIADGSKVKLAYSMDKGPTRGRPSSLSEAQLVQLMKIYYSKPYSLRRIADILGVSRMTVWRAVQNMQITI